MRLAAWIFSALRAQEFGKNEFREARKYFDKGCDSESFDENFVCATKCPGVQKVGKGYYK